MPKFRCTVAIPTRELFSGEIDYAEIPGSEGSYGVLAGHEMFVGTNRPGKLELWLNPEGTEKRCFVTYDGFAQVMDDELRVLARMGKAIEDIDAAEVEGKAQALRAEIASLEQKQGDEAAEAQLETHRTKLAWYELQLAEVAK